MYIYIYIYVYIYICLVGRVFTSSPRDLGSIPGRVIPKTLRMVFDTSLLNTQQCKVRIKGKMEQSREKNSAPLTFWCSSFWKGSFLVALDYGRQLYLLYIYICWLQGNPSSLYSWFQVFRGTRIWGGRTCRIGTSSKTRNDSKSFSIKKNGT